VWATQLPLHDLLPGCAGIQRRIGRGPGPRSSSLNAGSAHAGQPNWDMSEFSRLIPDGGPAPRKFFHKI